jgi:chromosome partitioning protein
MAHIIAIANHKGGVGKTTAALNIAAGVAMRGYSVLLIDMDAQANLTDTLHLAERRPNIYDVLRGEAMQPIAITEKLHAVPSTLDLAAAEAELTTAIGRERLLLSALQPLSGAYDYVIIDTAPTLGLLTINALTAADAVIIPMQAEYYAIKGIKGLTDIIANVQRVVNKGLHIGGVIISQYDTRTTLHRQMRDAIAAQFGTAVFSTPVRKGIAIAEAQAAGMDVFTYDAESAGAEDYGKVVDEFLLRFPTKRQ